jgi:uncharacterized protein (TIGR02145 family)
MDMGDITDIRDGVIRGCDVEHLYKPDSADINGVNLLRQNANLAGWEHFSHQGALHFAKSRGLRLPTREEWKQMLKPGYTWDEEKKGIWIGANHAMKQETDFSTFLPANGSRDYRRHKENCEEGHYWSSTSAEPNAFHLLFCCNEVKPAVFSYRDYGFSVRCIVD